MFGWLKRKSKAAQEAPKVQKPVSGQNIHSKAVESWKGITDEHKKSFLGSFSSFTIFLPCASALIELIDQQMALYRLHAELDSTTFPTDQNTFDRFSFFTDRQGQYIKPAASLDVLQSKVVEFITVITDKDHNEFGQLNHNKRQTAAFVQELYKLSEHIRTA